MDGDTFRQELRDEFETELARLGSSKALYAVTGGEMDGPSIRGAAAGEASAVGEILEEWAEDEADGKAAELFAAVAAAARTHAEESGAESERAEMGRELYDPLARFDATLERVGGLVARQIVAGELAGQMVGYFVGDADPATADTFRSIRSDLGDDLDDATATLESVCEDDDDWARAREAGGAVIEAAYDYYVQQLESMGIKPKNVC